MQRLAYWHYGATTSHWPDQWEAFFPPRPSSTTQESSSGHGVAKEEGGDGGSSRGVQNSNSGEDGGGDENGGDGSPGGSWDSWRLRELSTGLARSVAERRTAMELLGWPHLIASLDDDFYERPPGFSELWPVYSHWMKNLASQRAQDNAE